MDKIVFSEEEKDIVNEWKAEQIDAELEHYWTNDNDKDSPYNNSIKAIQDWAERNGCLIAE